MLTRIGRAIRVCAAGFLLLFSGAAAGAHDLNFDYLIGSTEVRVRVYSKGHGQTYFAPHYSETTAVAAAMSIINAKDGGGTLVQIIHGTGHPRNVTFTLKGVTYSFDPNRMFTDAGIQKSLEFVGHRYSKEAHSAVASFAWVVREHLNMAKVPGGTMIAIHNNSGGYSLDSYLPGEFFGKEAPKINRNPARSPSDFYFVTTEALYETLRAKKYNVALQNTAAMTDDGSLSVYCAQHGVPYVNIEARQGHFKEQVDMLLALRPLVAAEK